MKIRVLTLFPEMFDCLNSSITGRAFKKGIVDFKAVNIRDFSLDKHFKCDDTPYGGGAGMVMTPQPIFDAIKSLDPFHDAKRIYLSPKGARFDFKKSIELSKEKDLILLCGHYEGIDQRVLDLTIDEEISIGDYVLTGGELASMVLIDSVIRHIKGVLNNDDSPLNESFCENLLEYPQYTRPEVFEGLSVPEVLLSGHHKNIENWRKEKAREITQKFRPDLLKKEDENGY